MMNFQIALLFRKLPFVFLTGALITGILFGQLIPGFYLSLFLVTSCLIAISLIKNDNLFIYCLLLCTFSLGWSYHSFELRNIENTAREISALHEKKVNCRGTLQSIKETPKGNKLLLENISLSFDKYEFLKTSVAYFVYAKGTVSAEIGDTISTFGLFRQFGQRRNPGEFDFQSYYQRKNIFGIIFQDDDSPIIVYSARWNFRRQVENWRQSIAAIFRNYTDGNVAGLLSALILGDKSEVDPELREAFVETGVIHVLAVSGLHVGYVLLILLILTKFLRLPWGWDRIAIIVGLVGFVILTGSKPSVVRASMMAGLYILAPVVNRPVNIWNIIAAAAFFILIVEPTTIADLGFLLSFTAVISIIYFLGLFEKALPEKFKVSQIKNLPIKFVWGLFLVSLSAQIGTLPITAYYFGKIPVISLIANIIIVPLVGILVALGFSILLLGWLPFIGYGFGQSAWFITQIISNTASIFSKLPFASFPVAGIGWIQILQYSLLLLMLVSILNKNHRKKAIFIIGLMVNITIWSWAFEKRGIDIIFMDVGQGDATIIRFDNGKNMLIDAGYRYRQKDMGRDVILPVARHLGISKFDWVVMSHPHSDHIGGLVSIVIEMPIDTVWDSFADYGTWTYNHLLEEFALHGTEIVRPLRGEVYRMDRNTFIQVFAPDSVWVKQIHNVNNMSIVFRLIHESTSVLFTGDLEFEGDNLLLPYGNNLDSDVLKVAHHGSITSTTQPALELIQPEIAVISVGKNNKFSHPSPIVLNRLARLGIKTMKTDELGAIWLHSDGNKFEVVNWR